MSTPQERIEQLRAELSLLESSSTLDIDKAIEQATLESPSLISSPALVGQLQQNQPIAFINNKQDVVPGNITSINSDGTYDLVVYIPTITYKLIFSPDKSAFEKKAVTELREQIRKRARLDNPRTIFRKQMVALTQRQKGIEGIEQTHIDEFSPQGQVHIPKFHEFHTSLVGTFFDPSLYCFRIFCSRMTMEIDNQTFPGEEVIYPTKKPYYTEFSKAFNRYFKEYHQGMSKKGSKWNLVQIQVFRKDEL